MWNKKKLYSKHKKILSTILQSVKKEPMDICVIPETTARVAHFHIKMAWNLMDHGIK